MNPTSSHHQHQHQHHEREPLLPPPLDNHAQPSSETAFWHWPLRAVLAVKTFAVHNPTLVCTFALQFCTYFAKHMVEVPTIKLFEQAICTRHLSSVGHGHSPVAVIDERRCKIPAVQDQLATLTGLKFTFDALPGLLTALYYGSVADRFGRRLVLALCCAGTTCSLLWILLVCYADTKLPVKLVWLSSIFLCVGGSQRVAKGMNFTIIADTVDKSHRTRYMYLLAGIPHVTTLIAPPVSGLLMVTRIWLPFAVAIGALTLGLFLIIAMPEPLEHHSSAPKSPLLGPADTITRTDSGGDGTITPSEQLPRGIHDRMPEPDNEEKEWWRDIIVLVQMPGLPFCYLVFFLKPLAMISKAFVYQYASYNFHWGLSRTTWLRFAQAGGSSLATVVVLPLLSSIVNRRGLEAQMLDLNVIRLSLLVAATGFILLQLSYHSWMLLLALFICGLSEGTEPALQGLATSLIDHAYHARLFTSVAVVEILAKLVGGPVMGRLFSIGRAKSSGICFSVAAAILLVLLFIACAQRIKR